MTISDQIETIDTTDDDAAIDALTERAVSNSDNWRVLLRPPQMDEDTDLEESAMLQMLGHRLIREHQQLEFLADAEIVCMWKAKGGKSAGQPQLGNCQRPTGMLSYFSRADYVIWLAADHLRDLQYSARSIEALLFHQLLHCDQDEETGAFRLRGHDWAGFADEIRHYGMGHDDIRAIDAALQQLRLPMAD